MKFPSLDESRSRHPENLQVTMSLRGLQSQSHCLDEYNILYSPDLC